MALKKGLMILIAIALILAITAVSLKLVDSNEVPTSIEGDQSNSGSGKVGVTILPPNVEDKLADNYVGDSP